MRTIMTFFVLALLFAGCSSSNFRYYIDEKSGSKCTVLNNRWCPSRERQPGLLAGPYSGNMVFLREETRGGEESITLSLSIRMEKYHGVLAEEAVIEINGRPYEVVIADRDHEKVKHTDTVYTGSAWRDLPGKQKTEQVTSTYHSTVGVIGITPEMKQAMTMLNTLVVRVHVGKHPLTFACSPTDVYLVKRFLTVDGAELAKGSGCI
ncbi:MAG: hypothetical protein EPN93_19660 [Spirochaetes bacterium]|nr:MAG: hypothetical protein EPN93_19660 [Spirochaetota bacterium]